MLRYHCAVTPTDTLVAYNTDQEKANEELFAIVLENAQGQKISVLLSKDDSAMLAKQINHFVNQ